MLEIFFFLLCPGFKPEIVLAWPNLELVPGVHAMDLSASARIKSMSKLFYQILCEI